MERKKGKANYIKVMLSGRKPMVLFIGALLLLKLVDVFSQQYNALDYWLSCIQGFSYESINIINILYYLAYYIYPMFMIACFLEREKQDETILAKIRFLNQRCWDRHIWINCCKYLLEYNLFYWVIQFGITGVLKLLLKDRNSVFWIDFLEIYQVEAEKLFIYICASIILHLLELFILFGLLYFLHGILRNTTFIFLISFAGYLFTVLFGVSSVVNPFGSASLYNLIGKSEKQLIELFFMNCVWFLVLLICNYLEAYSVKCLTKQKSRRSCHK